MMPNEKATEVQAQKGCWRKTCTIPAQGSAANEVYGQCEADWRSGVVVEGHAIPWRTGGRRQDGFILENRLLVSRGRSHS